MKKTLILIITCMLIASAISIAEESIEGSIVFNNNADRYDSLAWQQAKWYSCNTDTNIPDGENFREGSVLAAGKPTHSYICYYNEEKDIERIAECVGDNTQSHSQTSVGGEWHVSGGSITAKDIKYYCCNDEWWHTNLDDRPCIQDKENSVCELSGYKISRGGELEIFGSYFIEDYSQGASESGGNYISDTINEHCCEDQDDEFYVTSGCGGATVTGKCCNDPSDKINDKGLCVQTCCTNKESDKTNGCTDGKDNDCDGLIDCADDDCAGKTMPDNTVCCQLSTVNNDCSDFTEGNCGKYSCSNNRCDVIEEKSKCSTKGECGAFSNSCTQQNDGSYLCNNRKDDTLCKTDGQEDYNKFCDIDLTCKDMSQYPNRGSCWLSYSECKRAVEDELTYTLPNTLSACPQHKPFSSCFTDQSKLTSTIGGSLCIPSGG
jgi:hypothetical protein